MAVSPKRIGTAELRAAMARKWCAPEYALVTEVADATGARRTRAVDALIMGLWPSRGILLEGVEIKTARSDWLREVRDPAKAEAVSRYCDRWWIHAAPDVVKIDELPSGWGLRIWDGRIWSTVVDAAQRDPAPIDRTFLAALLRRSDQEVEKRARAIADASLESERIAIQRRIEDGVRERTARSAGMADLADAFREATGLDPAEIVRNGEAVHAARIAAAILKRDLHNPYSGFGWLVKTLRDVADRTSEAMEEIGLPAPSQDDRLMRLDAAGRNAGKRGKVGR